MIESIVLLKHELGLDCIDWDGLLYLYQSNDYEPSANTPLNTQIKNWNEVSSKLSRLNIAFQNFVENRQNSNLTGFYLTEVSENYIF